MRILCVGVFDAFHEEHLRQLEAVKSNAKDVELVVGVVDDVESHAHAWTLEQRTHVLRSLKVVDSVVSPCPFVPSESFVKDQKIDALYHMCTSADEDATDKRFAVPIALGIFNSICYRSRDGPPQELGWDKVWERKGITNDASNVRLLTGYDETDFEPEKTGERWRSLVKWAEGETLLDVGCGSGFLGDFLPKAGYVGVEKSQSQADNFIKRSQRAVVVHDAENLPFKDNSFDHVISHSMLQYLPGKEAAIHAIQEMQRIARKTVFVGDFRTVQHGARPEKYVIPGTFRHTLFQRNDFSEIEALGGFVVSDGWWGGETRLNALWRQNDTLHVAVIGGGPAGCGLLTNYAINGEYKELLDQGVAIFDSSPHLGGGSLQDYASLRSNSHGCAFFDAIDELGIASHNKELNVQNEIPMVDMYRLQVTIGSWHEANLARHSISRLMTNTTVLKVTEGTNGVYCIHYSRENADKSDRIIHKLYANNVCICAGGIPATPSWVTEQVDPTKLEFANEYFTEGGRKPDGEKIAIIGFSHSAFSLGHLFHKFCPSAEITYIKRPSSTRMQPRIYFPSTDGADEHDYDYTDADICPETKRVHRFGGVRGDGRTYALSKVSYQSSNILNPEDYDHIIVSCGFKLNPIPIFDRTGTEIQPVVLENGTKVDARGLLFPNHRIYAFGLGAGLDPSEDTGGEPGCTRRADGIWLYQYTVGSIIRNAIKQRSTEWYCIYNRIGSTASLDTPLHHIGGYNQFSREEWDSQVRLLVDKCNLTDLDVSMPVFESGCGGGAFLDSLRRVYGWENVEGCDYSSACVNIANQRLPWGKFWVGDAGDLSCIPDDSKQFSFMFGVTPYLNDESHAERAVKELIRITKPGGRILIAENNDLGRKDLADSLRRRSHKLPSNHLFLPSSFWERFPGAHVLDHAELGLKYPTAPYRNSVVITKGLNHLSTSQNFIRTNLDIQTAD